MNIAFKLDHLLPRLRLTCLGAFVFFSSLLGGCSDNVRLPTNAELAIFNTAGPIIPTIDKTRIKEASLATGPYRIVIGDLLDVQLPSSLLLNADASDTFVGQNAMTVYSAHVDDDGMITVPIVGTVPVAGKDLSAAEDVIGRAFYPKFVKTKPPVGIVVREYKTVRVAISGGVAKGGIFDLRHDRMSLVGLLMESGGIVDTGAAIIRVTHQLPEESNGIEPKTVAADCDKDTRLSFIPEDGSTTIGIATVKEGEKTIASRKINIADKTEREAFSHDVGLSACDVSEQLAQLSTAIIRQHPVNTLILPVAGMNIPFKDVVLQEGDRVEVERLNPEVFTVMGLVNKPGDYPYPAGDRYALQALAFGGGVNEIANPRYVRVYRQATDGSVVDATFEIKGTALTAAAGIPIRPGDVVAVEQTPRTRRNLLLAEMFRFQTGAFASYSVYDGKDFRSANEEDCIMNNRVTDIQPEQSPLEQRPSAQNWINDSIVDIIYRHRWCVLAVVLTFMAAGFVYILKATPIYTSTCRLYVEESGPRILSPGEGVVTQSKNYLYTQAELLTSMPIIASTLENPEIKGLKTFADVDNIAEYLKKNINAPLVSKTTSSALHLILRIRRRRPRL